MKMIAAVNETWGIGKDNSLLYHIPEDMKFFREKTTGHTVVMGRNTFLSMNEHPLKGRTNIILSSDKSFRDRIMRTAYDDTVIVTDTIDMILQIDKQSDNLFIIGGERLYREFEPCCKTAFITKIYDATNADRYFPDLDRSENWNITYRSDIKTDTKTGIRFRFCTYENSQIN